MQCEEFVIVCHAVSRLFAPLIAPIVWLGTTRQHAGHILSNHYVAQDKERDSWWRILDAGYAARRPEWHGDLSQETATLRSRFY